MSLFSGETERRRDGESGRRSIFYSPSPRLSVSLLTLLLALPACSSFTSDAPPTADSTMVEVLVELHLADARRHIRRDTPPTLRTDILERHGLDESAFEATITYYAEHPDAYIAVYDQVLDRLSAERAETYGAPIPSEAEAAPANPFGNIQE